MKPWFKNVKPHSDIQQGILDESVFAANLGDVAKGQGREIYRSPDLFFSKTFFTLGIKTISKRVIHGLNGGQDAENRVVSLQTGFGGGKTHTLISLYHLAKMGTKAAQNANLRGLIDFTGKPSFKSANLAVFTNSTNDPAQGRQVDGLHIRTIWGEIAYQIGGKSGYQAIRENDEKLISPKGLFKAVLEKSKPCLILIDELADYCVAASAVKVGSSSLADQTISFMQELTEAISDCDNCVMIATLPASAQELAASPVATQILTSLENRITRVGANLKPVEDDEIFEVVRRRLFEDLGDDKVIESVVSAYYQMYQSSYTEIPSFASKSEYRDRMRKSYPFHPELIDMFRLRWASNPYFQRTRGVLRLLAAIVSDLWKRQGSLSGNNLLIHTSDVNFRNVDALSSQITMLYGPNYNAVINADIAGTASNAFRIDNESKTYGINSITQGISATILMATFGAQGQNKGIGIDELKLCMVKPDSFNHNEINGAVDKLEDCAHYLYYSTTGGHKHYWFHTKPNINILINQARTDVKNQDVEAEILKLVQSKTHTVSLFNMLVNPSEDIPEQQKLSLVILSPKLTFRSDGFDKKSSSFIQKLATKKGNSDRVYRNTILFLASSEIGLGKLTETVRDYLACVKINSEYQSQLEKEQKEEIRKKTDDSARLIEASLAAAYSVIAKYSAKDGINALQVKQFKDSFELQINQNVLDALKQDEWIIESLGISTLKKNNLFPAVGHPVKVKDIYEAFLRYDDKPMIVNLETVQRSLLKYCLNGEFAVASGDGQSFNKIYYQENVPFFDVNDPSYWLVDKSLYVKTTAGTTGQPGQGTIPGITGTATPGKPGTTTPAGGTEPAGKTFKAVTISGKVDVENYSQIFQSFIMPFAQNNNKLEIELKIKASSTGVSKISESCTPYKISKESAKQLGLKFEEEG